MPPFARDIEDRLTAVDERDDRQSPQRVAVEAEGEAPDAEHCDTKDEIAES
jgi:hypothetical protein